MPNQSDSALISEQKFECFIITKSCNSIWPEEPFVIHLSFALTVQAGCKSLLSHDFNLVDYTYQVSLTLMCIFLVLSQLVIFAFCQP